ncbi:hypothetical protein scyTo_0024051 [Scyliorhinus torazame]|uniref:Uncharacterized protein n=1 Tax=Scyliorhinus torazame TaxID=75743 RepID=A0A401QCN9_SCYTO|nr:hypothetical protein [Scyliorhinus torazame]
MIASTAYLDLFLRSIAEVALLKTFLRFIILHRHENITILDTLVSRISSNSRVALMYDSTRYIKYYSQLSLYYIARALGLELGAETRSLDAGCEAKLN